MLPMNPFDNLFTLQREFDRMFNQFWNDLPERTSSTRSSFHVNSDDDQWRIDVPIPGIDPKDVSVEVAGSTLTIRAGETTAGANQNRQSYRYEQTLTIPQFLDLDRMTAAHHHGMLQLTVPIKDSVKPRRIQITGLGQERQRLEETNRKDEKKQMTTA